MNRRSTARVAAAGLLGVLTAAVPATAAHAGPVSNGCPPSYDLIGIDELGEPYAMPTKMDTVFGSYGLAPNNNGLVCAIRLGGGTVTAFGGQYYNFLDDSLPAASAS